jgi:hypothetical protein
MKNTMLRSLTLLGISLVMALSVAAQEDSKVKTSDKESKYKSEDLKIKAKKEEGKYKAEDLKIKDEGEARKVKGRARPMQKTKMERTEIKTGETQVQTKEHMEPIEPVTAEPPANEPVVGEQLTVPTVTTPAKKTVTHKYAASKSMHHKPTASRTNSRPRYIVRTKTVRDTVFVASPPEKVVSTQTEYVHDTVTVTRVDTVEKMQKENIYTGYRVPRGNFKKAKLKKNRDDDEVWMKRK